MQAVLLHQSSNAVPASPNPAGLTEDELPLCMRSALLPLLEASMLIRRSRRSFEQGLHP